jgi:tetratricopeptide (TPR) repeat protein
VPSPTVRVFVSSTWLDLRPEREAVAQAVHRLRETKFVGMEHFGSRAETTHQASLDEVDRSEVYVAVIAARYGSGITEAEYDRARERNLPCFIYFKADAEQRDADPEQVSKLDAFKQKLRRAHTATEFDSPQDLAARVTADLHRWLFDNYLTPRLEGALRGDVSRVEAESLLEAVRDTNDLNRELLRRLEQAGYANVTGARGVAFSGRAEQVNINTGDTIYNAPALNISARHQLRAPVGDFVGRKEEIEKLTDALRRGASAAISGISGMGGIGKTELALYVADKLKDDYPDAQLLLDMRGTDDQPRDPADALASCVRAFVGLEHKLPDRIEDLLALYRDALNGKRALVLLDNARDAAQVRPLLPPPGSALLVTSRETIPLPGMTRLTLEQLQPAEARELLTSIAPRVPADLADQICYLCGYLPLAVRAAASLLDITLDLDPADYVTQLTDERTRLERIGPDPHIGLDVQASLGLSYQRLPEDTARVFRQLSVFPATFDALAEEEVCEDENHRQLTDLLRRNLVIYDRDAARYRLHDLARLFSGNLLSDAERETAQMRHAKYFLGVLLTAIQLYLEGGEAILNGLSVFDVEWKNIQAGQSWAVEKSGDNNTAAWLCAAYASAGELNALRRPLRETIDLVEAGLAAARRFEDRMSEVGHLNSLGYLYKESGDLFGDREDFRRAAEYLQQGLDILREIGSREDEAILLDTLGYTYTSLGEPQRALETHELALGIYREVRDRRGEGNALGNIGIAYVNIGEPLRSVEFYRQQLDITRETGDWRGEANANFNMGVALFYLGDRAQALAHVERALEIFEKIESPFAGKARAVIAKWRGDG